MREGHLHQAPERKVTLAKKGIGGTDGGWMVLQTNEKLLLVSALGITSFSFLRALATGILYTYQPTSIVQELSLYAHSAANLACV